jgi:hypothetical protein
VLLCATLAQSTFQKTDLRLKTPGAIHAVTLPSEKQRTKEQNESLDEKQNANPRQDV